MNTSLRISKKDIASKYFRFLYNVLDFDDARRFTSVLWIGKDKMIATDGKRIHIFYLNNERQKEYSLQPGIYTIKKGKEYFQLKYHKTFSVSDYPKFNSILNQREQYHFEKEISLIRGNIFDNSRDVGVLTLTINQVLSLKYLRDICCFVWNVYLKPDQRDYDFVYFKSGSLEAIIMPMAKY